MSKSSSTEPWVRTHVFETGPANSNDPPLLFVQGPAAFGAFLAPLMVPLTTPVGLNDPFTYRERTLRWTIVVAAASVLDVLEIDKNKPATIGDFI